MTTASLPLICRRVDCGKPVVRFGIKANIFYCSRDCAELVNYERQRANRQNRRPSSDYADLQFRRIARAWFLHPNALVKKPSKTLFLRCREMSPTRARAARGKS